MTQSRNPVDAVLQRIKNYSFHPIKEGLTVDRNTGDHGVANLQDDDWRIRTFRAEMSSTNMSWPSIGSWIVLPKKGYRSSMLKGSGGRIWWTRQGP